MYSFSIFGIFKNYIFYLNICWKLILFKKEVNKVVKEIYSLPYAEASFYSLVTRAAAE